MFSGAGRMSRGQMSVMKSTVCNDCRLSARGGRPEKEQCPRLFDLLDNLPGMAYRCTNTPEWAMVYVSDGARDLTGYPPGVLTGAQGRAYASLIHPADRRQVWQNIQQALDGHRVFTLEYRIFTADGSEKWVWEKGRGVENADGETLIEGFIQDITDHKKVQQALDEKIKHERQLHHMQKADSLRRLTGAISHHFNNKLQGLLAGLDLARADACEAGLDIGTLDIAIEAAQQAASVSRMLLLSLTGHSWIERHPLDLDATCRRLLPHLEAAMPGRVRIEPDLPGTGITAAIQEESFRQMVETLVVNAWEPEETTRIHLRLSCSRPASFTPGFRFPEEWQPEDREYAVLEVADNGPGISPTMIEQIFDPFFSTKFTGRGMGLTLLLALARTNQGGVIVTSVPGEGSVFRICLPRVAPDADGERPATSP